MSHPMRPQHENTDASLPVRSSSGKSHVEVKDEDINDDMITGTIDEVEGNSDICSSSAISIPSGSDYVTSRLNEHEKKMDSMQEALYAILAIVKTNGTPSSNNLNVDNNQRLYSGNSHTSASSSNPTSHIGTNMFSTPKTTVASAPSVGRGATIPPATMNNGNTGVVSPFPVNQTLGLASSSSPTIHGNSIMSSNTGSNVNHAMQTLPAPTPPYSNSSSLIDVSGTNKLPALKELFLSGTTVEQFIEWKRKLLLNVSQLPKYNGILTAKPENSWKVFCNAYVHHPLHVLEKGYLDTHQTLSAYIRTAIPHSVEVVITEKLKGDPSQYHLPTVLGLTVQGEYNAYGLLELLHTHYVTRTNHRLQQVIIKLRDLRYNGQEDPNVFFTQFRELHNQGQLLVPCWPIYSEAYLAHDLMIRLPRELELTKEFIMNRGQDHPKTIKEVEEALQLWWIKKTNHLMTSTPTTSSGNNYSTPNRNRKGGYHGSTHGSYNVSTPTSTPTAPTNTAATAHVKYSNKNEKWRRSAHGGEQRSAHHTSVTLDRDDDNKTGEHFMGCAVPTPVGEDESESDTTVNSISADANSYQYSPNSNDILFDTGAAVSITGQKDVLQDLESADRIRVSAFNGTSGPISDKKGNIKLTARVTIKNVRYVPSCSYSLLSIGQICDGGYSALFTSEGAYIMPKNYFSSPQIENFDKNAVITALKVGNLYKRHISKKVKDAMEAEKKNNMEVDARRIVKKKLPGPIPMKDNKKDTGAAVPSSISANATTMIEPSPPNSQSLNDDDY